MKWSGDENTLLKNKTKNNNTPPTSTPPKIWYNSPQKGA
jgi:hypothetical protein